MTRVPILFFNFDLFHSVRSSWRDISTKVIETAPSDHLCLLCKSRAQALRPTTVLRNVVG